MLSTPCLDYVRIPVVLYSKNLSSFFESSSYADEESYKNHGDVLQTSRVTNLQTCQERPQ